MIVIKHKQNLYFYILINDIKLVESYKVIERRGQAYMGNYIPFVFIIISRV